MYYSIEKLSELAVLIFDQWTQIFCAKHSIP